MREQLLQRLHFHLIGHRKVLDGVKRSFSRTGKDVGLVQLLWPPTVLRNLEPRVDLVGERMMRCWKHFPFFCISNEPSDTTRVDVLVGFRRVLRVTLDQSDSEC